MRLIGIILILFTLASCSGLKLPGDGQTRDKDDDDGRPSDETEGLLGYLRSPDLVKFYRDNRRLIVSADAGAISADDLDIETLHINVIQLPVEQLQQAQVELEATKASGEAKSPEDAQESEAPMNDDSTQDNISEDQGGMGAEAPQKPEEQVNDAIAGGDAGQSEASPPPDDGNNLLQEVGPGDPSMNGFSPAQLIVRGRYKGKFKPEADGGFAFEIQLDSPDPIVLVVGQFTFLDLIAVKSIDDPRVSSIIYSPAKGTGSVNFDENYLETADLTTEKADIQQVEAEWGNEAPYDQPAQSEKPQQDPNDSEGEDPSYPIKTLPGKPDAELDGYYVTECIAARGAGLIRHIDINGDNISVFEDWFKDDTCGGLVAHLEQYGRIGTEAADGDFRKANIVMIEQRFDVFVPEVFNTIVDAEQCNLSSWDEATSFNTSMFDGGNNPSCSSDFSTIGEQRSFHYKALPEGEPNRDLRYSMHVNLNEIPPSELTTAIKRVGG